MLPADAWYSSVWNGMNCQPSTSSAVVRETVPLRLTGPQRELAPGSFATVTAAVR
jgi:hypothetical protein